ncbi:MAG: hypothetical protein V5788_02185 [Shewanella sp.]
MLIKLKAGAWFELKVEITARLNAAPCSGNSKLTDVIKANAVLEANFIEYVRC